MEPNGKDSRKESQQIKQSHKQPIENEYESWWNNLDEEGKVKVDSTISTAIPEKGVAREAARMKYFRREQMRALIK